MIADFALHRATRPEAHWGYVISGDVSKPDVIPQTLPYFYRVEALVPGSQVTVKATVTPNASEGTTVIDQALVDSGGTESWGLTLYTPPTPDIPNLAVAWGIDNNADGKLTGPPTNEGTGEVQQIAPYVIKALGSDDITNATRDGTAGAIRSGGYTGNFLYAFIKNQGLDGAYNYPGGATVQAGEFKLDHNVGAAFNAQGVAVIDKAVFVPFASSTLSTASRLVDDVAVSATMSGLIDATLDANKATVQAWFADPTNVGQDHHTFLIWVSAKKEITFQNDSNGDLYTSMGDVVSEGTTVQVTVQKITDSKTNTWWLQTSSIQLGGMITDLYDFRADTWPAVIGAIIQAGYDGTASRTGGRIFKYELHFAGSTPVSQTFYFQNTPPL